MSKHIITYLLILLLASSCTERMVCPAYQSSFILDEDYRNNFFSPFEVADGDTVPKGYQVSASDTVLVATKTFYAQRGKRQPQPKEGFTYPKRKKKFFLTRIWSRPERPVLENPYLFDRIFKKRPYWKLDIINPEVVHYNNTDTVSTDVPMILDSLGQAVPDTTQVIAPNYNVLTVPERYKGYNVDQIAYNRKFGHLFPKPPEPLSEEDSAKLALNLAIDGDSTAIRKRKGLGLFKKKSNKNNDGGDVAGVSAEDLGGGEEGEQEEEEATDKKANKKKSKRKNKARANKKKADKKKGSKPKKKNKKDKDKKEGNDDGVRDEDDPEQP